RINRRLDAVEALKQNRPLREEVQRALDPVRDIERLVGRVAMARATPRDLGALRASLSQVPLLRAPLENHESPLGIRWRNADLIPELHTLLSTALQDDPPTSFQEGGIFAKGYRDDLDKLIAASEGGHQFLVDLEQREREKTGIPKLKVRFNKVFGYFIEVSRAQSHLVPDSYIRKQTLVNAERYITEELKEFESTVLNADALRKEREYELFHELVTEVAAETDRLRAVSRLVAETDAIGSLAQIADQWRYVRPELTNEPVLELSESRHPVIERVIPGGEQFVPNSMSLRRDGTRLAIITGPNMGGKSTVMRQAALTAIMAHMGSFVPASKARVGLLDRVFTRVGASDDLSRGISTFMAEMIETATILREATDSSLVILDEIGRGTSTYDGISIAWAVAEYLHNQSQSLTMFATHYHELTTLAEREKTITNWSVAVRQKGEQIVFLRQLEEGPANRSYGIQVAGLAGLPSDVQKRASELLGMLEAERENTQSPQEHAPKKSGLPQLSLFDAPVKPASTPPQPPEGRALTSALKQLKIEQLTPIQALLELDRLKHLLKDSSQEVH
ncbi:MAG: DNA mismatch repair protein MutS, partial [Myxococcota bacterium]|nr:DNA mismatch repair protein MutS [Myxococcota bacterium]